MGDYYCNQCGEPLVHPSCWSCGGSGVMCDYPDEPCPTCDGTGELEAEWICEFCLEDTDD